MKYYKQALYYANMMVPRCTTLIQDPIILDDDLENQSAETQSEEQLDEVWDP